MAGNIAPEEELESERFSEHMLNAHFTKQFPQEAGWLMSLPEHLRPGLQSLGLTIPPTWQAVTPDNLSWGSGTNTAISLNNHSQLIQNPPENR